MTDRICSIRQQTLLDSLAGGGDRDAADRRTANSPTHYRWHRQHEGPGSGVHPVQVKRSQSSEREGKMLSRFPAARSDAADRRAVSGIEGGGEYGIGRVLSRRPDHVVHTTRSAGCVWAVADREPLSVRGGPENSG